MAVVGAALSSSVAPAAAAYEASTQCTLADARITESSGAAVGQARPDVLFTHNDSGDDARFFAVDLAAGATCPTLASYELTGVAATDWEDMAAGPDDAGVWSLWFGDIGDNAMTRTSIAVHRVAEPEVPQAGTGVPVVVGDVASFELVYEDAAHDAETLLVHPVTGQLYVVTKSYTGQATVYAAPDPLVADAPNVLRRVADLQFVATGTPGGSAVPGGVPAQLASTAGDISRDGERLAIRTYTDAYEWEVDGNTVDDLAAAVAPTVMPTRTALPETVQGEALAYRSESRSFLVTTEGTSAPVHLLAAAPTPVVPEAEAVPWLAAAGAAAVAAALVVVSRRRDREAITR